jgi:hypothetical protein
MTLGTCQKGSRQQRCRADRPEADVVASYHFVISAACSLGHGRPGP